MILYPIRRANCDDLDIVLHSDFADDPVRKLVCLRTQRECKFALSVDRNASDLLPLLANDLNADTIVSGGGNVLIYSQRFERALTG